MSLDRPFCRVQSFIYLLYYKIFSIYFLVKCLQATTQSKVENRKDLVNCNIVDKTIGQGLSNDANIFFFSIILLLQNQKVRTDQRDIVLLNFIIFLFAAHYLENFPSMLIALFSWLACLILSQQKFQTPKFGGTKVIILTILA